MTTPPPWTAERAVDLGTVAALVEELLPDLRGAPVTALAQGWDNAVFVVGGQWALRFPRRLTALAGIRREVAVLPAIAPLLPLAVPVPELVADDHHPADPWPFTGARLIHGEELAEAALTGSARTEVAGALGAFLRVLHGPAVLDAARSTSADLPADPMQRGWPHARQTQTREVVAALVAGGLRVVDPAVGLLLDRAAALGPPTTAPVLVHGDLHVRHVLVDDHARAAGIIDWGDLCLADPAVDLGIAFSAFDGVARAALLQAYGPVEEETELRARALAVRLSALLADYAVRDHRPALLAAALRGLERAVR